MFVSCSSWSHLLVCRLLSGRCLSPPPTTDSTTYSPNLLRMPINSLVTHIKLLVIPIGLWSSHSYPISIRVNQLAIPLAILVRVLVSLVCQLARPPRILATLVSIPIRVMHTHITPHLQPASNSLLATLPLVSSMHCCDCIARYCANVNATVYTWLYVSTAIVSVFSSRVLTVGRVIPSMLSIQVDFQVTSNSLWLVQRVNTHRWKVVDPSRFVLLFVLWKVCLT